MIPRKFIGALCAAMMMFMVQVVPAYAEAVIPSGTYVMHPRGEKDEAMTIADGAYGYVLVVDKLGDVAKQQFIIEPVGDEGLFTIRVANTDLYLDTQGTRTAYIDAEGNKTEKSCMQVMAREYTGHKNQLWFAEKADEGDVYIIYTAYGLGKKDRVTLRYSSGKAILDMEYAPGKNYTWQLDKVNS